ncbi:MAG: hypothetical protein ACI3XJ_02740 [Oscillospiraceae bacterium]
MIPVLQSRWKLEGRTLTYYGLRAAPNTFRRTLRLSRRTAAAVAALDGVRPLEDFPGLSRLVRLGVVVDVSEHRPAPKSLDGAQYCRKCAANDYVIPGLELDRDGLCPMCATREKFRGRKNVLPTVGRIPPTPAAKYDAAVFYTGGKDSSWLLYHLAREQKLRVAALTWETPFMSPWARESIERAREALPEADFYVERAPEEDLKKIYRKAYELQKNVCICPSVAYVLFFQRLVEWEVPYLVLGNEPAQCKNLIYNGMAPAFYFKPWVQQATRLGYNLGRVLTLRRPFRKGGMELYQTVRQLAFGRSPATRLLRYKNELVENTCASLAQAPEFLAPFRAAVRRAGKTGRLPSLVHIDFDAAAGGVYRWDTVKELLSREMGWMDAPEAGKGLHTSCSIERCKEWSQFTRFRDMETTMIPFSAIEMSLASAAGSVDRDAAIYELNVHSGFTEEKPEEHKLMTDALE